MISSNKLREAAIELLKSAPDHIDGHWSELDEVVKALAQPDQAPANNLTHEIDLVLTDPESNLSVGAQRALRYVSKQLEATAPQSKREWVELTDKEMAEVRRKTFAAFQKSIAENGSASSTMFDYGKNLIEVFKERNT